MSPEYLFVTKNSAWPWLGERG